MNKRHEFGSIKFDWEKEMPDLLWIQKNSFEWFKNEGITDALKTVFPIVSDNGLITLDCKAVKVLEPTTTTDEILKHRSTYEAGMVGHFELRSEDPETGEVEVTSDNELFFGKIPYITDAASFIVNGSEKVVVSQIARSPGAYLKSGEVIKKGTSDWYEQAEILPARGAWLKFGTPIEVKKEGLIVIVDGSKKIPGISFMSALGVPLTFLQEQFEGNYWFDKSVEFDMKSYEKDLKTPKTQYQPGQLDEFLADRPNCQASDLLKVWEMIKPGEPATLKGARNLLASKFFDTKKYLLSKAGRFKINQKLSVLDRIYSKELAAPILDKKGKPLEVTILEANGSKTKVVLDKGLEMSGKLTLALEEQLKKGNVQTLEIPHDKELIEQFGQTTYAKTIAIKVCPDINDRDRVETIFGVDPTHQSEELNIADIFAAYSYKMSISDSFGITKEKDLLIGQFSDVDHLSNKRVKHIGELLVNQFNIGLKRIHKNIKEKMSTASRDKGITLKKIINGKPLVSAIKEFYNSSQLSQFLDETNPLSSLTNKRRISAIGPGGLRRDADHLAARDVHKSHYGRLCPIETPEGPSIGLITTLATMAKINDLGFITTPYYVVKEGKVTSKVVHLTADEEEVKLVSEPNIDVDSKGMITQKLVKARYRGEYVEVPANQIHFAPISPKQIISASTACIPFLENDDANRALMGANMQRQAVPLMKPDSAYVGTGIEGKIARDSGVCVLAKDSGTVTYVDANTIKVDSTEYNLKKYRRTNQGTTQNHRPIVKLGQKVKSGEVIADGMSVKQGEIALGQNVTVAFMTWDGYNYEDAIIMSERLVKDDIYTSIHITQYTIDCLDTKLGPEEVTRDVPNTSDQARMYLAGDGIIMEGTDVKAGDILVGKITPRGQVSQSADERFLEAIFGEKSRKTKDSSLRMPNGSDGTVVKVERVTRDDGVDLPKDVLEQIRIFVAQKRKIKEGDKMAGRHGNKGVISKIMPAADMPRMADGTPVDIMLNPLGIPSRMNVGQVLEVHLAMAAKALGVKISTPVFDGATNEDVKQWMKDAKMPENGKYELYDGRTGEKFVQPVTVGVMHMIKLAHMIDDKLHARSVGPYSLITQQPLGGKAQKGGQRFGEMEVWALEAYGAANTLQEILTLKSDDMVGRTKLYESLTRGTPAPTPSLPESFKVLRKELMGQGIRVHLRAKDGTILQEHDTD